MGENELLEDFHTSLRARYPRDGVAMTYAEWICENTHLKNRKFSFADYAFQVAIANDMSESLAVIKPSQVGLTEIQLRKFLAFLARNRGTSGIFTLPNLAMYKRVSKVRAKPLILSEKAFQNTGDEKGSQSMDLYELPGGSFAYFTAMLEGDATSIPADMLSHDELDLSDQRMVGLYQSRLQNSIYRITQKFSTPSHPGYGIDAAYSASTQSEYLCVCRACNHWQVPLFDMKFLHLPGYLGSGKLPETTLDQIEAINFKDAYVKCERCAGRLDVLNPADREWVAKFPSRRTHGYRIRALMTRSLMIEYIFRQLDEMRRLEQMKGWYNTVLGEPFSDGSNQLTDEVIKKVMKGSAVPEVGGTPVAIGVDVGQICHIIVGAVEGEIVHPFLFLTVPVAQLEEKIKELCETYNVVAGAIDRLPYTPTAMAVSAKSGKKILPAQYTGAAFITLKVDEFKEIDYAQINRTAAIDRVVNLIRRQVVHISGYGPHEQVVIEHLKDMIRIETPEQEARWEKLNGNDHFFHALALLQIAPRIYQVIAATNPIVEEHRSMIGIVGVKQPVDGLKTLPYRTRSPTARSLF